VTRGRELLVGVVIIAAIAVGVGGTLWLQGRTFGPIAQVDVLTESVGQLGEGNSVQYRGVRIGQVATIGVLPDGSGVRVRLILQSDIALPSDPAVILATESVFGGWQAEIVSQSSYPTFPFFPVPADMGGDVPVLGGYALPELSRLTRSAEQISENIESLTERLEIAFNEETATSLASVIDNIEAMTVELRTFVTQQAEVAGSITANADSALAEIELAAQAARRTFEQVEVIVADGGIDALLADMRAATTAIRDVASELADPASGIGTTLQRADSALTRLDRIAARIESGDGSLGRLLGDSTFLVRAEDVLEQVDLLLKDLQENPRRYVRLSIF
jgi:phospholipid/cholesterol/gamma-HCH transport system substrate-binding protein